MSHEVGFISGRTITITVTIFFLLLFKTRSRETFAVYKLISDVKWL